MDTGSTEWVGWLAAILTGGIAGYVAKQKGYSFWAWCFAGCLNMFIILFLPKVGDLEKNKQEKQTFIGNTIGIVVTVITFVWGFAQGFFQAVYSKQ
jgi:hypothetical protein